MVPPAKCAQAEVHGLCDVASVDVGNGCVEGAWMNFAVIGDEVVTGQLTAE
jgi:hypothetical protein